MAEKKFRGSATKNEKGGWHVELDASFKKELENMDPEDRAEIEEIIQGIKEGEIDPLKLGNRMCSYCGNVIGDVPDDVMMCRLCAQELR
jgi:hypothetical protein